MVMQFLKRRRHRGGQFISFTGTNNESKPTWRKCDKSDIVQQMMEAAEGTDSTAQMSSSLHDNSESGSEDSRGRAAKTVAETLDHKKQALEERPSWLKRPMFADICGNHAMVNAERQWGNANLHPLKRSRELDDLAREHAQEMAAASMEYHADPSDLVSKLTNQPQERLGANVAKGMSLRDLHNQMKKNSSIYANMMDNRYQEFGIGTARDAKGDLFLCQIYRG